MRIRKGNILIVNPAKSLVIVLKVKNTVVGLAWLKNYWKTKYNIQLPKSFKTVIVNFPNYTKPYEYPIYKKCIKKPLRQKKYLKLFSEDKPTKKMTKIFKIGEFVEGYDEFLKGEHERRMFDL